MIDYMSIIDDHYTAWTPLYQTLLSHSHAVAEYAVWIARRLPPQDIDITLIHEWAMLHDIGIYRTNNTEIWCNGDLPYLQHQTIGEEILLWYNLPDHARIAATHGWLGFSAEQIAQDNLPLPHRDLIPITSEEKIIAFADLFFMKKKNKKLSDKDIVERFTFFNDEKKIDRFIEYKNRLHLPINL